MALQIRTPSLHDGSPSRHRPPQGSQLQNATPFSLLYAHVGLMGGGQSHGNTDEAGVRELAAHMEAMVAEGLVKQPLVGIVLLQLRPKVEDCRSKPSRFSYCWVRRFFWIWTPFLGLVSSSSSWNSAALFLRKVKDSPARAPSADNLIR